MIFEKDTPCRLLIDGPCEGAWNMAVDETLLEKAESDRAMAWRFYEWTPATLSLGFFQGADDRNKHSASLDSPLVRRASGGGAILHDRELTYGLAVPLRSTHDSLRLVLYRVAHETLIDTLGDWGVTNASRWGVEDASVKQTAPSQNVFGCGGDVSQATGCGGNVEQAVGCGASDAPGSAKKKEKPFLCFQRFTEGDVVLPDAENRTHKVVGSAQRRSLSAVVQHGSVLLDRSEAAPELPGICDLTGTTIPIPELREAWLDRLQTRLNLVWEPSELTASEKVRAQEIVEAKYANDAWTIYKGRK
jgi:lipoate-protein ligase A